jgi:hypothetical protein
MSGNIPEVIPQNQTAIDQPGVDVSNEIRDDKIRGGLGVFLAGANAWIGNRMMHARDVGNLSPIVATELCATYTGVSILAGLTAFYSLARKSAMKYPDSSHAAMYAPEMDAPGKRQYRRAIAQSVICAAGAFIVSPAIANALDPNRPSNIVATPNLPYYVTSSILGAEAVRGLLKMRSIRRHYRSNPV